MVSPITVVGVGNPIMGDDGTGLALLEKVQADWLHHHPHPTPQSPAAGLPSPIPSPFDAGDPRVIVGAAARRATPPTSAATAGEISAAGEESTNASAPAGDKYQPPTPAHEPAPAQRVEVSFVDGGTSGMELLPTIQDAGRLLLLDAVAGPGSPGSVIVMHGDQIPRLLQSKLSPHQVGLLDLLSAARLLGKEPTDVAVVGIVAGSCELEVGLSPAVSAALDQAARAAVGILRSWGAYARP